MINKSETKGIRRDVRVKNDDIRIWDNGGNLKNIEVEREESEKRNCHCHRRRMIVLARKAGTVDTKGGDATAREGENYYLSMSVRSHPLLPSLFMKGLSVRKLLAQREPTDGAS